MLIRDSWVLWVSNVPTSLAMGSVTTLTIVALIADVGPSHVAVATSCKSEETSTRRPLTSPVSYVSRTIGQVLGVSLSGALTQAVLQTELRKRITGENVNEVCRISTAGITSADHSCRSFSRFDNHPLRSETWTRSTRRKQFCLTEMPCTPCSSCVACWRWLRFWPEWASRRSTFQPRSRPRSPSTTRRVTDHETFHLRLNSLEFKADVTGIFKGGQLDIRFGAMHNYISFHSCLILQLSHVHAEAVRKQPCGHQEVPVPSLVLSLHSPPDRDPFPCQGPLTLEIRFIACVHDRLDLFPPSPFFHLMMSEPRERCPTVLIESNSTASIPTIALHEMTNDARPCATPMKPDTWDAASAEAGGAKELSLSHGSAPALLVDLDEDIFSESSGNWAPPKGAQKVKDKSHGKDERKNKVQSEGPSQTRQIKYLAGQLVQAQDPNTVAGRMLDLAEEAGEQSEENQFETLAKVVALEQRVETLEAILDMHLDRMALLEARFEQMDKV